jgi:hypothetical protein
MNPAASPARSRPGAARARASTARGRGQTAPIGRASANRLARPGSVAACRAAAGRIAQRGAIGGHDARIGHLPGSGHADVSVQHAGASRRNARARGSSRPSPGRLQLTRQPPIDAGAGHAARPSARATASSRRRRQSRVGASSRSRRPDIGDLHAVTRPPSTIGACTSVPSRPTPPPPAPRRAARHRSGPGDRSPVGPRGSDSTRTPDEPVTIILSTGSAPSTPPDAERQDPRAPGLTESPAELEPRETRPIEQRTCAPRTRQHQRRSPRQDPAPR